MAYINDDPNFVFEASTAPNTYPTTILCTNAEDSDIDYPGTLLYQFEELTEDEEDREETIGTSLMKFTLPNRKALYQFIYALTLDLQSHIKHSILDNDDDHGPTDDSTDYAHLVMQIINELRRFDDQWNTYLH